jgi:hypothetical protein
LVPEPPETNNLPFHATQYPFVENVVTDDGIPIQLIPSEEYAIEFVP